MAGATVGTYIITRALKFNMPKRLVVRMLANQAIDSCVGIVPFLGDIFDIGFKVCCCVFVCVFGVNLARCLHGTWHAARTHAHTHAHPKLTHNRRPTRAT
jgi:hypothetical protein